jgi:hypothetical protein
MCHNFKNVFLTHTKGKELVCGAKPSVSTVWEKIVFHCSTIHHQQMTGLYIPAGLIVPKNASQ